MIVNDIPKFAGVVGIEGTVPNTIIENLVKLMATDTYVENIFTES